MIRQRECVLPAEFCAILGAWAHCYGIECADPMRRYRTPVGTQPKSWRRLNDGHAQSIGNADSYPTM